MSETVLSKITAERIYLHCPGAVLSLVIKIQGEIGEDEIQTALGKNLERHPLVHSKVVMGQNGQAFFAMDPDICPKIRTVERTGDSQWREIVHKEETEPIDIFSEVPMRVLFLKGKAVSELIFHWHRILGDGPSLALFAKNFLEFLGGEYGSEQRIFPPMPIQPEKELTAKAPRRYFLSGFMRSNMNNAWRVEKKKAPAGDFKKLTAEWLKSAECDSVGAVVSQGRWEAVLERCRKRKYNPQIIFLAALYKAAFEPAKSKKDYNKRHRLAFESDIRAFLSDPRSETIGSFSSVISIYHQYVPFKGFWENVAWLDQCVKNGMKEEYDAYSYVRFFLDTDPTLIDLAYLQFFELYQSKASKTLAQLLGFKDQSVSRILFLPDTGIEEQYGNLRVQDVQLIPGVLPENRMMLGAVDFRGKLNLNLAAKKKTMDYASLKKVMNELTEPIEARA